MTEWKQSCTAHFPGASSNLDGEETIPDHRGEIAEEFGGQGSWQEWEVNALSESVLKKKVFPLYNPHLNRQVKSLGLNNCMSSLVSASAPKRMTWTSRLIRGLLTLVRSWLMGLLYTCLLILMISLSPPPPPPPH